MLKEEARGSRAISGLHWLRARLHFGRSEPGMCGPPSRERHSRAENVSALPAVSIRAGAAATSGRAHLLSGRSRTKHALSNLSRFSAAHCLHQPRRDAPCAAAECVRREQLHRASASSASLHKDHGSGLFVGPSRLPCCFSSVAGTLQLLPVREATSRRRRRSTNHNNAKEDEQRRDGRTRNIVKWEKVIRAGN